MDKRSYKKKKRDYAVLVGLRSPVLGDDSADEESLAELAALVDTAGGRLWAPSCKAGTSRTLTALSARARWRRSAAWSRRKTPPW